MSFWTITFLLVLASVDRSRALQCTTARQNFITVPIFRMRVIDLPHDRADFTDIADDANEVKFFCKLTVDDDRINTGSSLDTIFRDFPRTVVTSGTVLYDRMGIELLATLLPYECTQMCYNVSIPLILSTTGWTLETLENVNEDSVRIKNIHFAALQVIESRFCCNFTTISAQLGIVNGVERCAYNYTIWELFVSRVSTQTIQCKADFLAVTPAELSELLRANLATLLSYNLFQLENNFFPIYDDLLARKNLFETKTIVDAITMSSELSILNWMQYPMAKYADVISSFTSRDLEILYRWQHPQVFAIDNIPLSVYSDGCSGVSLAGVLHSLSVTLFGFSDNLPSCDIAFLLSRSINEDVVKYTISNVNNQNVLDIFRTSSGKPSWFDIFSYLQLARDEGIWVETPSILQVSARRGDVTGSSIPEIISYIRNFNTTNTLNDIMRTNYASFLTKLLNVYGYSASQLAQAAAITELQLNTAVTIQQAHNYVLTSSMQRYDFTLSQLINYIGIPLDLHILINLPSFEWDRIIVAAIKAAFDRAANAYSVQLSTGGVQITNVAGGLPSIQVSDSATYHVSRVTSATLASCLGTTLNDVYALSFSGYHSLFSSSIISLLRNKMTFETSTLENLLAANGLQFANVKDKTVAEVITQLTGLTTANLLCLYPFSSTFLATDLGKTFENANTTRLCNDFLGLSLYDIAIKIQQTPDKICFLCSINPCFTTATCTDIPNSFICTCPQGFTGNGRNTCDDILECNLGLDNCHVNATCTDGQGSFECECKTGFTGNGVFCSDNNECVINPTICGLNGICRNTIGSYYCDCTTGYQWNGVTCVDVNECDRQTDNCNTFAVCTNTMGSFTCKCIPGLTGNGVQCEDIKECSFAAASYPCHVRADCTEIFASYRCQCRAGYTGDGKDCTNIDECALNIDTCHSVFATCFDTDGSYFCQCNSGFTGDGRTCTDINECTSGAHNCHVNANCNNTPGSFTCDCKDGFNGDGINCYVAQVSFAQNSYTVIEGGSVAVDVSLSGNIDEQALVIISHTGSASTPQDYTLSTTALVFSAGVASTKTITIQTVDDNSLETSENIVLTLSTTASHVEEGAISTTTIFITDNDAAKISLTSSTLNVLESQTSLAVQVQIDSGTVERDFSVRLATIGDGTAGANDYTAVSQVVTFGPLNINTKIVNVPINNDALVEGTETFSVLLTSDDSDVEFIISTATVNILDDDKATIKLSENAYVVSEANSAVVRVLLQGNLATPVSVSLSTSPGLAQSDVDYGSIVNRLITFNPGGQTSIDVTINIVSDSIYETTESFVVTLTETDPNVELGDPETASVSITDDDVVSIVFSPTSYEVEEADTTVNVKISVQGLFAVPLTLSVMTVDDTASENVDYIKISPTPVVINVGESEKIVPITIREDSIVEHDERFYLDMSSTLSNIVFPTGKRASVVINDEDSASVIFQRSTYTISETGGEVEVSVVLSGTIAKSVTVRVSTVHDTATWPLDFTPVTNQDVVFQPGETPIKTVSVTIVDDDVVEEDETFSVNLAIIDDSARLEIPNVATVTIDDDDQLDVHFSSPTYFADEEMGYVKIGLNLGQALAANARVRLTPRAGTAITPDDFPFKIYDIILPPGESRIFYYNVNITNDMLEEDPEYFYLDLTRLTANIQITAPNIANITITKSDDVYYCDPNARSYPCHIKANCLDVPGSFTCTCMNGYSGTGLSCSDINECESIVCPFNGMCQNIDGSYSCICATGYVGDGVDCRDVDECTENTDNCHPNAKCTNNLGSFSCNCNTGYDGPGTTCTNINECTSNQDNCDDNARCDDTPGSFVCTCLPGFMGDGEDCDDIKECEDNTDECSINAKCTNTVGSYTCTCNDGYSGDGRVCTDINECTEPSHNCHTNAVCSNEPPGTFRCDCKAGFDGNGTVCQDIDECTTATFTCPANSDCNNNIGSYDCLCESGYSHVGAICQENDECALNTHDCHASATCTNTPAGSFTCTCNQGFTGDGKTCTDINECTLNICHEFADCGNTIGSYTCTCRTGYTGNGTYCEDIIDCRLEPNTYPCDVRADCRDTAGSYICICPNGFTLNADDRNCDDINECRDAAFNECHVNAQCLNIDGSYNCKCNEGFAGDGRSCVDTTCPSTNPCSQNANCSVNVPAGTFLCICHEGFTGDGQTCDDINECDLSGSCGANADCNNNIGSYSCACRSGYEGDPYVGCTDINDCFTTSPCHVMATCAEIPGSFKCTCKIGYTGSGLICSNINECELSPCNANARCDDDEGSFDCTCNSGYTGNGFTCNDINECSTPGKCGANADCRNEPAGSYTCVCRSGFTGNANVGCVDIKECESDPCDDGAMCEELPGSFRCVCPENLYHNGNFCHVFCPFKLDLAFLVDTSQSISSDDFIRMRNFMIESVSKMEVGENANHIAVIPFGNTAEVFMYFNTLTGAALTRQAVMNRLGTLTHSQGATRIDLALLKAETVVFTEERGMRTSEQIRKVAVVITDGKQSIGPGSPEEPLRDIARRLQGKDVSTLAIGVGSDIDRDELLNITNMIEENVFEVMSFANLEDIIFRFINMSCTDVNECHRYSPCAPNNAQCRDTLGAYSCMCNNGFSGNGFSCQDINECAGVNDCDVNASCDNTQGSFTCECNSGFNGDGRTCNDNDECAGANDCHANAACTNTPGSYTCQCRPGHTGDGRTCIATDCPLSCPSNSDCVGSVSLGWECKCHLGYTGNTCVDINECATGGTNTCDVNATCDNTQGSYTCTCRGGYTGDGRSCTEIDECALSLHTCHADATCRNEPLGSYTCVCKTGLTGTGRTCDDINECMLGPCSNNANCDNTRGSYTCTCRVGYTGDGNTCSDINECATGGTNTCDVNAECGNTQGSYTCTCRGGYVGDGRTCTAVGICSPSCGTNAVCVAGTGGDPNSCVCSLGYTGDGQTCTNINECASGGTNNCHANAACGDTQGSYTCTCRVGYTGDGRTCTDINECASGGPNTCDVNAVCGDTQGSYTCTCKVGYTGDGRTCTDINECASGGINTCDVNAACGNTQGSYTCTCRGGYVGDGRTCTAITCIPACGVNAECVSGTGGSPSCACKSGYSRNGQTCSDVNECNQSNSPCHIDATCANTDGSYTCTCKTGYSGDGKTCSVIRTTCVPACAVNQVCQTNVGSATCICKNPGMYLYDGMCKEADALNFFLSLVNETFVQQLADESSQEYMDFANRLANVLSLYFKSIYGDDFLGLTIENLASGSINATTVLYFKPGTAPKYLELMNAFNGKLQTALDGTTKLLNNTYVVKEASPSSFSDYNECHPSFKHHTDNACGKNTYCYNKDNSYECRCTKGYERGGDDICVAEDDDWWVIYAVIFASIAGVLLLLIFLFCCLECTHDHKERYTLQYPGGKHDARVDQEVAPGFPGHVPRSSSHGSQLLLKADANSNAPSDKIAAYEMNPIYDSANG